MRILASQVYLGPNVYALFPVIRLELDLGALEEWPTARLGAGFIDGLLEALPGLREHGCTYREPGGFVRRLHEGEGTWLGHVLEHVAIELQNVAGTPVTFGKTRGTGEPGCYNVVYEYEQPEVGVEAGRLGLHLLESLLPPELRPAPGEEGREFDFQRQLNRFIRFAQSHALGPSTASLVAAAKARGIPWLRLNGQSLIQLGHGRFQQRIQATITSKTPHIAVELASDKEETVRLLGELGLPVPKQRMVYDVEDAVAAARRIGYPVVVKPLNANHGRGVSIRLTEPEQVEKAFATAREHSRAVLVESFLDGLDHRLLVVNGELVAASKRMPGHVVGDGQRSVAALVDIVNQDPRRGVGHEKVLTRLELDEQALRLLAKKGYDQDTVPAAGETVYLRATANLSTGGTAIDVTDVIHPENRQMAVRAIRAIGLDVGGVDFLTPDITRSYKDVGGGICEVNAAPGFRMHVAPSEGTPRDAAGPVIDMLFPPGSQWTIPICAITGTNGKTTTSRMVAHIMKLAGHRVGLASTDGVYIDGDLSVKGDMTGPVSAQMILRDPTIDAAVLETARGGLVRRGMGYTMCDVGAVLNISSDHLGLGGVDTLEQLAEVKRIVVEVARDMAVLNADDALCLQMADHTEAKHLCYVTMNPRNPLVREHIRLGARAVVLEEGINGHQIVLYDKGSQIPLLWTHLIPATLEGRAMHNVQNAMFAAAITFGMGKKLDDIRHGLRTFDTSFFQAPGRMNIFSEYPFKVILDYGHNPAAVRAMCQLVQRMPVSGRRSIVLTMPGDRRNEDIAEVATIAAGVFDRYILKRDDHPRGRGHDEVPRLLERTLLEQGVAPAAIEVIIDEQEAVRTALETSEPGDLLLIFGDNVTRCWKQIVYFGRGREGALAPAAATAEPPPPENLPSLVSESDLPEGATLIRDERGVRLARVPEESD
ncbi:MAG: cyanophycin synthetase [Geminicoccaceae bacterium]